MRGELRVYHLREGDRFTWEWWLLDTPRSYVARGRNFTQELAVRQGFKAAADAGVRVENTQVVDVWLDPASEAVRHGARVSLYKELTADDGWSRCRLCGKWTAFGVCQCSTVRGREGRQRVLRQAALLR